MNIRSFLLLTLITLTGCMEPPLPVETVEDPGTYVFNYDNEYVLDITSLFGSNVTVTGGIVHIQMSGTNNILTVNSGTEIAECTLGGMYNTIYNNTGTPITCTGDGVNGNVVY